MTAVMILTTQGNLERIQELYDKGASILLKSDSGKTALHYCARDGNLQLMAFLLENGAQISGRDNDDLEPLGEAILAKNSEMASFLIQKGARITTRVHGRSYLILAEQNGLLGVFKDLLAKGIDLKIKGPDGLSIKEILTNNKNRAFIKAIKDFEKNKSKF